MNFQKWAICLCGVLSLSGCGNDLEKRVDDLEDRVERLEEFCRKMNGDIEALRSLVDVLSEADRITSVLPIREGTETIGYTITFDKSDPVTIYNGRDAEAPVVGVRPDDDGVYCWTLNGEWLLDDEGRRIPARGQAGAAPQLKIDDGRWYVSYDGTVWTEVDVYGRQDGGIFSSVTTDDAYVYFTLSDGTVLVVPLAETAVVDVIPFEDDLVRSICLSRWDTDHDGELSVSEACAVTSLRKAFTAQPIRTFREFAYFTGVTALADDEFCDCDELEAIVLPEGITRLGDYAFCYCLSLTWFECRSQTPPAMNESVFDAVPEANDDFRIRVPATSLECYRTAEGWSSYADRIIAAE